MTNKDLLKKCQSIQKKYVKNNTIEYIDIYNELRKNKKYTTEYYINEALNYFIEQNIIILENSQISGKNLDKNDVAINNDDISLDLNTTISDLLNESITSDISEETDTDTGTGTNIDLDTIDILKQYLVELSNIKVLSKEQEYEVAYKYYTTKDIDAKNILIRHNLKLVVYVAKSYKNLNIDFLDIIQYGNIGLLSAVEKFNPTLGYRFSTYAVDWIKQSILRGITNSNRLIRLPSYTIGQVNKINQAELDLASQLKREPTEDELIKYINKHKLLVSQLSKLDKDTLHLLKSAYSTSIISYDTPIQLDDDSITLLDSIPDTKQSIETYIIQDNLRYIVNDILSKVLDNKEKLIIQLRFGLNNSNKCYTCEQIAKLYNMKVMTVRRFERNAIRKLRHNPYCLQQLTDFHNKRRKCLNNI